MRRLPKNLKLIFKIIIVIFALWGFLLTSVFFAMKLGLTKSGSIIDKQSQYFKNLSVNTQKSDERIIVANQEFAKIQTLPEWEVIKLGILKDKDLIQKVAQETGVPERLIITPLIAEQLRLMTSQREIFKRYFQPLVILGSQTQFSLGIYGIKEGTAKEIERNLKNPNSQYYLGKKYENLLDYSNSSSSLLVDAWTLEPVKNNTVSTTSTTTEYRDTILLQGDDAKRVKRLINEKNHYYSYLYAALYLKQLEIAWSKSGFPISNRPEILATLFNIGFQNSHPKANPEVGGAEIELGGKKYTFGSISFYFYFSDELTDLFPR